jgi:hypothetical protein
MSFQNPETVSFQINPPKDEIISTVPSAEVIYSNTSVIIPSTGGLSGSLSDSQDIVEVSGSQMPPLRIAVPHEDATDASLLQNFGNQTADALIIETTSSKRKASIESIMNPETKRNKLDSSSGTNSADESYDEDSYSQNAYSEGDTSYVHHWSSYVPVEPLPLSVTLPFLRAFAHKKFDEPIPLFVPPALPVGQPHHWPALLSLPPLLTLPTMIPLYPQNYSIYPYYAYQSSDMVYSQDSDAEEEDEEEEGTTKTSNGSVVSPLTTLASLASGTVKD